MKKLLSDYIINKVAKESIPTVQVTSDALDVSPGYLSGMLKSITGESTQQHIHNTLITVSKEKLSTTILSISEIAYDLGFAPHRDLVSCSKTKQRLHLKNPGNRLIKPTIH